MEIRLTNGKQIEIDRITDRGSGGVLAEKLRPKREQLGVWAKEIRIIEIGGILFVRQE